MKTPLHTSCGAWALPRCAVHREFVTALGGLDVPRVKSYPVARQAVYFPVLPFKLSRIAPWLRSASLPLVNLGLQFSFSRFICFRCELSLKFRYSPSHKIWSS
jgi:hypothetical protein